MANRPPFFFFLVSDYVHQFFARLSQRHVGHAIPSGDCHYYSKESMCASVSSQRADVLYSQSWFWTFFYSMFIFFPDGSAACSPSLVVVVSCCPRLPLGPRGWLSLNDFQCVYRAGFPDMKLQTVESIDGLNRIFKWFHKAAEYIMTEDSP